MDMITVLGDVVVHGWLRQDLELHGLRRTQRFQHRIKPLSRPREQTAKPIDGDPVQGRTETVVGGLELLPEDVRLQEPGQLLVVVEPAA
jgi:hypothetical protein